MQQQYPHQMQQRYLYNQFWHQQEQKMLQEQQILHGNRADGIEIEEDLAPNKADKIIVMDENADSNKTY